MVENKYLVNNKSLSQYFVIANRVYNRGQTFSVSLHKVFTHLLVFWPIPPCSSPLEQWCFGAVAGQTYFFHHIPSGSVVWMYRSYNERDRPISVIAKSNGLRYPTKWMLEFISCVVVNLFVEYAYASLNTRWCVTSTIALFPEIKWAMRFSGNILNYEM